MALDRQTLREFGWTVFGLTCGFLVVFALFVAVVVVITAPQIDVLP